MPRIVALLACLIALPAVAAGKLLVFGDSLSAGHGIALEQSWPALLQTRLNSTNARIAVINASISGETTAGGRSRLPAALRQHKPQWLILALGANDGLRGLPLAAMQTNLEAMIDAAHAAGARVLLVGMRLPPNYGPDYTERFATVFEHVARRKKVALLPFLLEPIAADEGAFQADRLHPTAVAQARLAEHVWTALRPLLKSH